MTPVVVVRVRERDQSSAAFDVPAVPVAAAHADDDALRVARRRHDERLVGEAGAQRDLGRIRILRMTDRQGDERLGSVPQVRNTVDDAKLPCWPAKTVRANAASPNSSKPAPSAALPAAKSASRRERTTMSSARDGS